MANNNTAVARVGENMIVQKDGSLKFGTVADIFDYSSLITKAGMAPKGKSPEQITVSIIAGAQLGLNPFAAMQNIAVINGMPSVWGDAAQALVLSSGQVEDIKTEYLPNQKDCVGVKYTIKRKGIATPFVGTFSITQAKQAGLWGKQGPWSQYPTRMLFNRARAFALRDGFADILKGLGIAEEVCDIPQEAEVTVGESPIAKKRVSAADLLGGKKEEAPAEEAEFTYESEEVETEPEAEVEAEPTEA